MVKLALEKKFRRYRQIGNILVKYGFGIILEQTHLFKSLKIAPRKKRKPSSSLPVRVRMMFEELGPTFIKLGQILSTRPDLIPFPFIEELEKLQDEVSPVEVEKIEEVISEELGRKAEEIFASFQKQPLASASIAQVHRATLKGRKKVAVKIQRPGIAKLIRIDLQILYDIASLMERFIKEAEVYQPVRIVEEFERTLKKELDFTLEANNIERFSTNFSSDNTVCIPKVYRDFTTKRILTLQYMEGIKINKVEKIKKLGLDRKKIAQNGANVTLQQIFSHGFFHADPHPGNIFILKDGRICYLDFGIVGKLDEERRIELTYLLNGFLNKDAGTIVRTLTSMEAIPEDVDIKSLQRTLEDMLDRYYNVPVGEIKMREVLEEEFEAMRKFRVNVPADLALLAKTLITIEGVGLTLDPDFNLTSQIQPFVTKLIQEKLKITNLLKELKKALSDLYFTLKEIPASLETFLRNIKKGYINIAFEHKGLQNLTSTIDKSSNRISFSLIIAALLISSSRILLSGKGPLLFGFSVFGFFGFAISAILGLWLLISILRQGKL